MKNLNSYFKNKQIRLFAISVATVVASVSVIFLIYEYTKPEYTASSKQYKTTLSTGVEGLSDPEMWIEKSTNDLSEIKNQNKKLQEQLDQVQKVVVGVGKYMRVFDDKNEAALPTALPAQGVTKESDAQASLETTENSNSLSAEANMNAFNGMNDFVSNIKNGGGAIETSASQNNYTQRNSGRGISTITFSNVENEYDLDENFIFASTYARCVLVGSTTVSAGIGSSANPQPVLLRLTDTGNLPNRVKGFLKDAMVIGAAYGELSSESVVIRLERIVKIDKKHGVGIDIPIEGYVAGENGDSRIRGTVIDRAGAVVRSAAVGGFFSGIAETLTTGSRQGVTFEPNSGLAQFSPQGASKMLQQGGAKGIGSAVEKYADFYIKRAEQLQPVIKIDGGRKLTIVFTKSVKASTVHMKIIRKKLVRARQAEMASPL